MVRRLSVLAVMGFLALPALANAQQVGPARGSLVIVGGAMRDPAILRRFIELAGGPQASIVIIPTAGGGDDYDQFYGGLSAFRAQGATNLTVLHTNDRAEADSPDFVKPITEATGVWFPGGRQWRLVDAYGGTLAEVEIRKVLGRGGVIGGSSAGASIQGSYLARGDSQTNTIMMGDHEVGFGYLKNTAIDQHVLKRNRQFDMIEIIEARPELLGIGIDENTAIVVTGDRFEVIGESYVLIYDNQKTVNGSGRFYFLAPGDNFNLATREGSRPTRSMQPVGPQERDPWPRGRP
ncbi:MAG: cyanophycinase [Longimicrobiales bacterium]